MPVAIAPGAGPSDTCLLPTFSRSPPLLAHGGPPRRQSSFLQSGKFKGKRRAIHPVSVLNRAPCGCSYTHTPVAHQPCHLVRRREVPQLPFVAPSPAPLVGTQDITNVTARAIATLTTWAVGLVPLLPRHRRAELSGLQHPATRHVTAFRHPLTRDLGSLMMTIILNQVHCALGTVAQLQSFHALDRYLVLAGMRSADSFVIYILCV
ncbi:hypothetical protein B0H14DRAFT_2839607 [Mycena olivaceomarginata]|nr:hypothetical protein B0H14DRAFT_2839607 [Mycena olivaceomarginata]